MKRNISGGTDVGMLTTGLCPVRRPMIGRCSRWRGETPRQWGQGLVLLHAQHIGGAASPLYWAWSCSSSSWSFYTGAGKGNREQNCWGGRWHNQWHFRLYQLVFPSPSVALRPSGEGLGIDSSPKACNWPDRPMTYSTRLGSYHSSTNWHNLDFILIGTHWLIWIFNHTVMIYSRDDNFYPDNWIGKSFHFLLVENIGKQHAGTTFLKPLTIGKHLPIFTERGGALFCNHFFCPAF